MEIIFKKKLNIWAHAKLHLQIEFLVSFDLISDLDMKNNQDIKMCYWFYFSYMTLKYQVWQELISG